MDALAFDLRRDPYFALYLDIWAENDPEGFAGYLLAELRRDEEAGTTDPFEEAGRRS